MQAMYLLFLVVVLTGPTEGETAGAPLPAGTAFNFQGQLKHLGVPVNSPIDGRFSLWAHPTSTDPADQVGGTVAIDSIAVTNGLFSIQLDFGSAAFNGDARWLQVEVRESDASMKEPSPQPSPRESGGAASGGKYSTLKPREPITPSPYSLQTRGIFVDDSGRVGIGTQTPDAPLEVASTSGDALLISGGSEPRLAIVDQNGVAARIGSRHGDLTFRPDGSTAGDPLVTMMGDGGGKVGIGHAFPAAKLDVQRGWDGEHGALTLRGGEATLRLIHNACANAFGNCSWIIRMNGGNLEFSRKTAPTTWTPVISLTQAGRLDIGLQIVESGFVTTPAQASCPPGKRVISGACWCGGNMIASQPNGNAWLCECAPGVQAFARAFCARIE